MENGYEEREILISDLFREIIKHWKILLMGMIILAIGFSVYLMKKEYDSARAKQILEEEYSKEDFSNTEWTEILNGIRQRQLIEIESEYIEKSELMKINANRKATVSLYYEIIPVDDNSDLISTKTKFMDFIKSDETLQKIMEELEMDIDVAYFSERISIFEDKEKSEKLVYFSDSQIDEIERERLKFEIKIIGIDLDGCALIADTMDRILNAYADEWGNGCQLVLINTNKATAADYDLLKMQMERITNLQVHRNAWSAYSATLTDKQITMIDQESSDENLRGKEESQFPKSMAIYEYFDLRNFVIGALGGLIIVCLVLILHYLFSNKIKVEKDFVKRFRLPVFGTISIQKKDKNRIFCRIDRKILSFVTREQNVLTEDEQLERTAFNIISYCEHEGISKLVICETKENHKHMLIAQKLIDKLEEKNLIIEKIKNPIYDLEAFIKVNEVKNILLCEDIGQVTVRQVSALIEYPNESWKIIGAVFCK